MVWVMKNASAVSARYDCIVQAHNKHGWSAPSTIQTYYHDTGGWQQSFFCFAKKNLYHRYPLKNIFNAKALDKSANALRGSFPLSLKHREEGFLLCLC